MNETITERIKRLQRKYDESILEDYSLPDLDRLIEIHGWRELLYQLKTDSRQVYRFYLSHRSGDCTFSSDSIDKLKAVTQQLLDWEEAERNSRWVVRDNATMLYWCRTIQPPYWGRISKAFLFKINDEYVEALVKNTNRKFFHRVELVKINATKRLNKPF